MRFNMQKHLRLVARAQAQAVPSPTPVGPNEIKTRSLAEMIASVPEKRDFLIPYLVPDAGNLLVTVEDGVDSRMLQSVLAYCCAGKKRFDPCGTGLGVPILFCSAAGDAFSDAGRFDLLLKRDPCETTRKLAETNFHIYHRHLEGDEALGLNTIDHQDVLDRALQPGCKAVFFDDVFEWVLPTESPDNYRAFGAYVRKLNKRGIAVVAFASGGKGAAQAFFKEMHQTVDDVQILLAKDPGAPKEYGGGCKIVRRRLDEFDPMPTTFSFRYTVVDKVLRFGWAIPDRDAASAKEMEMIERQMMVKKLLAEGKLQCEIAKLLKVDPGTVSRDREKIEAKEKGEITVDAKPEDDEF